MKYTRKLLAALLLMSLTLAACSMPAPKGFVPQPTEEVNPSVQWKGNSFVYPVSIGKQWLGKTVASDPPNSEAPQNWLVAAHEEITFPDYPVKNLYQPPRILIFAVSAWQNYNPEAEKRIQALKQLLKDKPATFGAQEAIPVLPVFNAAQVLRAHVDYLNFGSGSGVRFITQYDQAPIPINNAELFYSFQGLTSNGNYYIAAFFPTTLPTLPADGSKTLEAAANDRFSPAISALDSMLQSLTVK